MSNRREFITGAVGSALGASAMSGRALMGSPVMRAAALGLCCASVEVLGGSLGAASASAPFEAVDRRVSIGQEFYWVEEVARGLKFPTSIVWLPNGDALVAERRGDLRIIRQGALDPAPIEGVPVSFQNSLNGLKEVLLDPDYLSRPFVYLLISEGSSAQRHAAVYRARYDRTVLKDVVRLFRAQDELSGPGITAGRMLFLPDKTLLVAVCDDNFHKNLPQQLNSHIGKLIRIDRDGAAPRDNPFLNTAGALPEIWSYGHRAPSGLYHDQQTGLLWEVEPGPLGGDELNVLKAGANFGWAKVSLGFDYNGGLAAPLQSSADTQSPLFVWMLSSTPSGITRYSGSEFPSWRGDFFVGHLSAKAVERLRIEDGRVVFQELMLMDLNERIREVKEGPDHRLYVLTDHPQGRVLRLRPDKPRRSETQRVAHKLEPYDRSASDPFLLEMTPGDPKKGREIFLDRCIACHSVGDGLPGGAIGPDLKGVYGRAAGNQLGFNYSTAMSHSSQVWDLASLNLFLTDPGRYFPGTRMAIPPVSDPEERRQIVGFLLQQSGK